MLAKARAASTGTSPDLGQRLGRRKFHFTPLPELVFFTPDAAHLRTRVTRNHGYLMLSTIPGGVPVTRFSSACFSKRFLRTLCADFAITNCVNNARPFSACEGHQAHDLGVIVVFAQMAEDERAHRRVQMLAMKSHATSFDKCPLRPITRCFTDHGYGPTFSISRS